MPIQVVEFVEGLEELGIYGTKKGEIYRYFIQEGMRQAIRDDVIRKHVAGREELAKLKKR